MCLMVNIVYDNKGEDIFKITNRYLYTTIYKGNVGGTLSIMHTPFIMQGKGACASLSVKRSIHYRGTCVNTKYPVFTINELI